jgi:thioredoxin reductase (NADPH)
MEEYDLIIIGGGPAGYSAAIYAARYNLKTLVIVELEGGLISTAHLVENYPGFISLSGQDLANHMLEHVEANNVPILNDVVSKVKKEDRHFIVQTQIQEETFKAKSIVLATGSKHRHLNVPGEKEFMGRGVSYCATCDGNFFKDKTVGIVGGGNVAAKDTMVLAKLAKKVYIFVRSYMKAEPINIDYLKKLDNVEIIEGVNIKQIQGDKKVESVVLDKEYNSSNKIELDGLFVAIGHIPQNSLAKQLDIELNNFGEIKIDNYSQTSMPGVMAAGDVTDLSWKQVIVSASQGAVAGFSAYNYIINNF